jgi:hypothetical protein
MAKEIARLGIILTSLLITTNAAAVTVADLLISEIMVNPGAVSDTRGEWFELYNPTTEEINLNSITIGDDGGDSHKIETDLLILPGHFLTLARNGDAALNGGLNADYVYDDFTLSNSGDEILLHDGPLELQSRELIDLPMIEANYGLTLASLTYGIGDLGTPGAPGSASLAPSAVPLPAAAWLFITAIIGIFKFIPANPTVIPANLTVIPANPTVIPANPTVIPANLTVIPAQAGISRSPGTTASPATGCCAT